MRSSKYGRKYGENKQKMRAVDWLIVAVAFGLGALGVLVVLAALW